MTSALLTPEALWGIDHAQACAGVLAGPDISPHRLDFVRRRKRKHCPATIKPSRSEHTLAGVPCCSFITVGF